MSKIYKSEKSPFELDIDKSVRKSLANNPQETIETYLTDMESWCDDPVTAYQITRHIEESFKVLHPGNVLPVSRLAKNAYMAGGLVTMAAFRNSSLKKLLTNSDGSIIQQVFERVPDTALPRRFDTDKTEEIPEEYRVPMHDIFPAVVDLQLKTGEYFDSNVHMTIGPIAMAGVYISSNQIFQAWNLYIEDDFKQFTGTL